MIDNDNLNGHAGCEHLEAVSAYYDGELDGAESEKIKKHIDECEECRSFYESLLGISEAAEKIEIPASLHASIMSALKKEQRSARPRFNVKRISALCGAGIAAVLCFSLIKSPFFRGSMEKDAATGRSDVYVQDKSISYEADADGAEIGGTNGYSNYSSDMEAENVSVSNKDMLDSLLCEPGRELTEGCVEEIEAPTEVDDAESEKTLDSDVKGEENGTLKELKLFFPSRDKLGEYYK